MNTEDGTEGAVLMHEAGDTACEVGHEAMIKAVEEAFPDNVPRQVGALITGITMLYAHMLNTCIEAGGQKEAQLAVGMVKVLLAEPLSKVAKLADGGSHG